MNGHSSTGLPRYVMGIAILVSALLFTSCNFINSINRPAATQESTGSPMTLQEALATETEDQRPTVLEKMGVPDAFSIRFDTLEGQVVRWESWSYFDFGYSFDFVDGELLWTVELEPVEDGALYAHFYTPEIFQANMSVAEVQKLLYGRTLVEIDLKDENLANGLILAGDQILLGFEQDQLVYVETLILTPEEGELAGSALPTQESQPATKAASSTASLPRVQAPRPVGTLIFEDDFDSVAPNASPFFSERFMTFENIKGQGQLVSNTENAVVVAIYNLPSIDDFIAEFDVSTEGLPPDANTGLLFRGSTGDKLTQFYKLVIRPSDDRVGLQAWKDGKWVADEFWPIPPELKPENSVYRIRLEVQGESFRVFISDSFVTEFIDNQITQPGRFGLTLTAPNAPQSVLFDNLSIYQLP